jgi:hypothetical protein
MMEIATSGLTEHPHRVFFAAAALSCLVVALVPLALRRGKKFERRCYWGGTFGAAASVIIAAIPDWIGGLLFACVTVFAMWLPAYFGGGELIKIGGRVYSFHIQRSTEKGSAPARRGLPEDYPDAYGTGVTAAKFWSLLIVAMVFVIGGFAIGVTDPGQRVLLVCSAIAFVVAAVGLGYGSDGSYGYPVARRQYAQFVLISMMSAGAFAVLYLPAWYCGRRFPFRYHRSLERQARPDYWKK